MHGSRLLVFIPGRPGEVSTDDGFDREDLELPHLHAPILERRPERFRNLRWEVEGDEVGAQVGDGLGEDVEPFLCAESQENAFVGDAL